jgi:hypothetical protein
MLLRIVGMLSKLVDRFEEGGYRVKEEGSRDVDDSMGDVS